MKNLKNKRWLAGMAMILFVFGIFFIVKAVEKKERINPSVEIVDSESWYFTGTSNDDITKAENYSSTASAECGGLAQTICEIKAPADPVNSALPDMEFEVEANVTVADQIEASLQGSPSLNSTVKSHRSF